METFQNVIQHVLGGHSLNQTLSSQAAGVCCVGTAVTLTRPSTVSPIQSPTNTADPLVAQFARDCSYSASLVLPS